MKVTKPQSPYVLGRKLAARQAPAGLTAYAIVGNDFYHAAVYRGDELVGMLDRHEGVYGVFTPRGRRATKYPVRTLAQAMSFVA
jgi:hypothetical protein